MRRALVWGGVAGFFLSLACAPRQTVNQAEENLDLRADTAIAVETIRVETVRIKEEPTLTFETPDTASTALQPDTVPMTPESTPPSSPSSSSTPTTTLRTVSGYRVQIFATLYPEKAEALAEGIRTEWGVPVYVIHDPADGLYKVRVGDFRTRAEAEALRDRFRSRGFTDAFLVQDQVHVSP